MPRNPRGVEIVKKVSPEILEIPLNDLDVVDVSDRNIERMARGFIMGSQAVGRRKEIREMLEEKVTRKIGRKGKYLSDKLFELIEGVYVIDKRGGKGGKQIRYYQVPPNLNAIIYALDRVLGKPKVSVESTEEKRGLILVEHVIKNLAQNPYKNNGNGAGENDRDGAGGIAGSLTERIAKGVGESPF